MRRQDLIRHSSQCHKECIPKPDEDIYSHEDDTSIEHEYIRSKHLNQHFRKYQQLTNQGSKQIKDYQISMNEKLEKLKLQIDIFQKELNQSIDKYLQKSGVDILNDQKDKFLIQTIKDNNFEGLSCFEMSKLIKLTDVKYVAANQTKIKAFQQRKIEQFEQSFVAFVKKIFEHHKIEVVSVTDKNLLNMIKLNQSSIIKVSNESVATQELGTLDQIFLKPESQAQNKISNTMGKKPNQKVFECQKEEKDEEQHYDIVEDEEERSFYSSCSKVPAPKKEEMPQIKEKQKSFKKQLNESKQLAKANKKKYKLIDACVHKESQKSKLSTQLQSDGDDPREDNEQMITQSVSYFQSELQSNASNILSAFQENYITISDLDDIIQTNDFNDKRFNIRVKVVKVLYFCVILQNMLKVKFIAGDQTGIAVFFTNYWKQIKAGCQLELNECRFFNFKDSIQLSCDSNFKKINEGKDTIIANINGIRLSSYIEDDLYYCVHDKNCTLIRQAVERLNKRDSVKVSRMFVKVIFILNDWDKGVFCQVGDSSGLILAYLKKDPLKKIEEGQVVKLFRVTVKKGVEPNQLIKQKIYYIDTFTQTSRVLPFRQQFLDISENILTPEEDTL